MHEIVCWMYWLCASVGVIVWVISLDAAALAITVVCVIVANVLE